MKYIIIIALLFSIQIPRTAIASQPQGCPMSSAEKLVCSVVICNPIGLAIAKSRSECLQVNRKFAIYLATLGFWSKPPKCKSRDQNCNKTGRASKAEISANECNQLGTVFEQKSCIAAITDQVDEDFCNQLTGRSKRACQAKLPPPPPVDCGKSYIIDKDKDTLGQCLDECNNNQDDHNYQNYLLNRLNQNSCVIKHSDIDCEKLAGVGSEEYNICKTECTRWGLCSTDFTKGFNADFTNDFEKQFKQ